MQPFIIKPCLLSICIFCIKEKKCHTIVNMMVTLCHNGGDTLLQSYLQSVTH